MQSLQDQADVNDAADITSVYYDEPGEGRCILSRWAAWACLILVAYRAGAI